MSANKKNNELEFEEKARKAEKRQKRMTQAVCLILAALMALGGTISVLVTVFAH